MIINPSLQDQIDFYNKRWNNQDYLNGLKLERCVSILSAFGKLKLNQPYILELGCGNGWLSGIFGNWGPTTGIDLSIDAINRAKGKYPYVDFLQHDILSTTKPFKLFDIIISHEVIEHIEDQKKYIEIAHNFLRPGGYLILTTPNKKTFSAMTIEQKENWPSQPIEKWLTIKELRKLITPEFSLLKLETIIPGYDAAGILKYLNSYSLKEFIRKLGFSGVYEKNYLSLGFGLHIILVAQKKI